MTSITTLFDTLAAEGDAGRVEPVTLRAAINRAAMLLGGGDAVLIWAAFGYNNAPPIATRAEMAREMLDALLEALRTASEMPPVT